MSNAELLKLSDQELFNEIPQHKRDDFAAFIKELNRREYLVRFDKSCTFDTFEHLPGTAALFKDGFIVDGRSVPYFHPNRSFHDEIIWLNENLFYNPNATFEDKLINAAIVKFYGPSKTLKMIIRNTGDDFVVYDKFINDYNYLTKVCLNLENAVKNKEKIYGTTELRTSLQTAARNYARSVGSPIDKSEKISAFERSKRSTRPSDILFWFTLLGPQWIDFYRQSPTMKESFEFLNSYWGIGNYYGYHFTCNLARMPEVGNLIFEGIPGKIDEDDEYVVAGVGAMHAINWFYEHRGHSINDKVGKKLINAIRQHQKSFFDLKSSDKSDFYMSKVSELGFFTNFGCEISCCQFGVYRKLRENKKLARKRASAPISKEEVTMIITPKSIMQRLGFLKEEEEETVKPEVTKEKGSKPELTLVSSPAPESMNFSATDKELQILSIMSSLGGSCKHSDVANIIKQEGYSHYKQKGTWKESWMILQKLVKKGAIVKDDKVYRKV
jgi:hypothetical protein